MTGRSAVTHNPPRLTRTTFSRGLQHLSAVDPDLARVIHDYGPPPLWFREQGFPTLVLIILEQQVSLASAQAAFHRLVTVASPLTPGRFMALDDPSLKAMGFSRQKIAYSRHLAGAITEGDLNPEALTSMDDAGARSALLRVKGIGPWSADIYLLRALRRPDVWPAGDLAIAKAVETVKRLPHCPPPEELDRIGRAWQPWRAVAARVLWHFYLNREPGKKRSRP